MAGRTRVLVTHQRQFLPRVDRIAVLRGGRLIACDKWDAIVALDLPELTSGSGDGMEISPDHDDPSDSTAGAAAKGGSSKQGSKAVAAVPKGAVAVALPATQPGLGGAADSAAPTSGGRQGSSSTNAAATTASGDDGDDDVDAAPFAVSTSELKSQRVELERIRTMAPDINARAMRAGQPRAAGMFDRRGSFVSSLRALSRAFSDLPSRFGSSSGGGPHPHHQHHHHHNGGIGGAPTWRWRSFKLFTAPNADGEKLPRSARSVAAAAASATTGRAGQLVKDESRETGGVSWGVYGAYARQNGLLVTGVVLLMLLAGQAVAISSDWWLALWAYAPVATQLQPRYIWVRVSVFIKGRREGGGKHRLVAAVFFPLLCFSSQCTRPRARLFSISAPFSRQPPTACWSDWSCWCPSRAPPCSSHPPSAQPPTCTTR